MNDQLEQSHTNCNSSITMFAEMTEQQYFECHLCLKRYSKEIFLKSHMFAHDGTHETGFKCICIKNYSHKPFPDLDKFRRKPKKIFKCICDICQRPFTEKNQLAQHLMVVHEFSQYRCITCNKLFINKNKYERHMQKDKVKERNCCVCAKKFMSYISLLNHMKEQHPLKQKKNKGVQASPTDFYVHSKETRSAAKKRAIMKKEKIDAEWVNSNKYEMPVLSSHLSDPLSLTAVKEEPGLHVKIELDPPEGCIEMRCEVKIEPA